MCPEPRAAVARQGATRAQGPGDREPALALLAEEVDACRARPLYRDATHAVFGEGRSVERERGRPLESELAPLVILTAHRASALRGRDAAARHAAMNAIVADLRVAARGVVSGASDPPRHRRGCDALPAGSGPSTASDRPKQEL